MADFVSLAEIQQWLETTKLTLAAIDANLEATAKEIVFSAIGTVYDTTTWVDAASTPPLVRKIISMMIAGWTYERQYSEDIADEQRSWGARLVDMANSLLTGLADRSIDITGVVTTSSQEPVFWPNDNSVDDEGNLLAPVFTMGQVF